MDQKILKAAVFVEEDACELVHVGGLHLALADVWMMKRVGLIGFTGVTRRSLKMIEFLENDRLGPEEGFAQLVVLQVEEGKENVEHLEKLVTQVVQFQLKST